MSVKVVLTPWVNHDGGAIYSLDVSPTEYKIATCGNGEGGDGLIVIWSLLPMVSEKHGRNVETRSPLLARITTTRGVNSVRWSRCGKYFAAASDDKTVSVWEFGGRIKSAGTIGMRKEETSMEKYRCVHSMHGHSMEVLSVEWSWDGRFLASASIDHTVIVWNALKLPERLVVLDDARDGHTGSVKGLSFDPIGKYLATQSDDKTLRVWSMENWVCERKINEPFEESAQTTMFMRPEWSPDGKILAAPCAMNNGGPTAQLIMRSNWDTQRDLVGNRKAVTVVRCAPRCFEYEDYKGKMHTISLFAVGSRDKSLSPICIHGKPVEEMKPEDFEVDGDRIYSRARIHEINNKMVPIERQLWIELFNHNLNLHYLEPESDEEGGETPVRRESGAGTPASSKKKRQRRKSKKETPIGTPKRESTVEESQETPEVKLLGQCTAAAIEGVGGEHVQAAPATPAASKKPAKRELKLIKMNSEESSDMSMPSAPPTPTRKVMEETREKLTSLSLEKRAEVVAVKQPDQSERKEEERKVEEEKESKKEEEKEEEGEGEEVVVPEKESGDLLQPTYEELYITLREYEREKVERTLRELNEWEFAYSFDPVALTAGFRCDLHCTACDSTKHLVASCPQLKIPAMRNISCAHWKPFYGEELDRVIGKVFEDERIGASRQKELDDVMGKLRAAIASKIKTKFRLDAFGSSENGFGSKKSDFDVCFRFTEELERQRDVRKVEHQLDTIKNMANALTWARFERVMQITTAKVPIVKFTTRVPSGEIEGDISYYNELALHNTRLLKRYCTWTKDDTLAKLGMFIKRWAKQCEIGDASKGSLSSYAYIILLIHFLQRIKEGPLLPVLQEMGEKREVRVDGWDVYFCDDAPKPDWSQCSLSVSQLFIRFLEFYAKFDWLSEVVQIRQIRRLTKIEKGWTKKQMCIEDPFDLDHNLSTGISTRMYAFILKSLVMSREVFLSLKERETFIKQLGPEGKTLPIPESHMTKYGNALLWRCRANVGGAPRDRLCFKCGRFGHFSDLCPAANNGFSRRDGPGGGGRGRGGARGGRGEERGGGERGGAKTTELRNREVKKERLEMQRKTYTAMRTANEK